MRKIADIVTDIREEISGAEAYAKKAVQYREKDPALSVVFLILPTRN